MYGHIAKIAAAPGQRQSASHDASLSLPAVKNAIGPAKPKIAAFSQVAVTMRVGGQGLPSRNTRE
jgi:hypothetical protein